MVGAEVSPKTKKLWSSKIRRSAGPRAGCSGKGEWRAFKKVKAPPPQKQKTKKAA